MSKILKLRCIQPVNDWHTVGAVYEFRFSDEEEDSDGYLIDDYEEQHWITLPNSDKTLADWDASEYFVVIGEEEDHVSE